MFNLISNTDELDLSAKSAGIILEFCAWDTNSEVRPRANHCLWHSSASAPKRKKCFSEMTLCLIFPGHNISCN